jgi:hypothetical protein
METMKKLFMLLFSLGALTTVFAQRNESRDVILGQSNNRTVYNNNDRRNDTYSTNTRDRDIQIQRIRQDYAYRIESVQRDRRMRNAERKRQVRFLEQQRDQEIQYVINRYSDRRNVYSNNGVYNDRNYRSGNRY